MPKNDPAYFIVSPYFDHIIRMSVPKQLNPVTHNDESIFSPRYSPDPGGVILWWLYWELIFIAGAIPYVVGRWFIRIDLDLNVSKTFLERLWVGFSRSVHDDIQETF